MRFFRCNLSDTDPRYARYPVLPVVHCQGYQPVVATAREPAEPLNP